jgi:hypothetical protein
METAIGVFLRFYTASGDVAKWQNFFLNKTVSGHAFRSFEVGSIVLNRSAGESGIDIEMPTTKANLDLVEAAIEDLYLVRVTLYEMPSTSVPTSLSGATAVGTFVGEVIRADVTPLLIRVEVGSAMDAVTGDIPGRKITTSLVGRLPKL